MNIWKAAAGPNNIFIAPKKKLQSETESERERERENWAAAEISAKEFMHEQFMKACENLWPLILSAD